MEGSVDWRRLVCGEDRQTGDNFGVSSDVRLMNDRGDSFWPVQEGTSVFISEIASVAELFPEPLTVDGPDDCPKISVDFHHPP